MKKRVKKIGQIQHIRHIEMGEHNKNVGDIDKIMTNNFISLQGVLTDLAIKMENLTSQMTKLLEIFETSAKALSEKGIETIGKIDDKKILEKLDELLEQNKTLAKSVSIIAEGQTLPTKIDESSNFRNQEQQGQIGMNQNRFKPWPRY